MICCLRACAVNIVKAMSYVLPRLSSKKEVDRAIKETEDKVLVLRFGKENDLVCMQLDEIVSTRYMLCVGPSICVVGYFG